MINNSTGNYIQYLSVACKGKESEMYVYVRVCVCVCVCVYKTKSLFYTPETNTVLEINILSLLINFKK